MFVESKGKAVNTANDNKLDAFARRHPGLFDAALIMLAVAITIGLLAKPTHTLVLYQGF